jgi:environmental stress-induced protein Ves
VPAPTSRTFSSEHARTVPWLNGQGTTREVIRVPDQPDWYWRLAVATSTTSAPFSAFPGVDRELLLLHGEALELRFRDGSTTRLSPGERTRFAGENAVVGVPTRGATEQLNLLWRRDRVGAHTAVAQVTRRRSLHLEPATWLVVHVLDGAVSHPFDSGLLEAGDTTVVTGSESAAFRGQGSVFSARLFALDARATTSHGVKLAG